MTNPNTAPSAAQPYAIDGVVYAIARKDQREAYVMFDTPAQANGFVEYMRRFIEKPEVASRDAGGAASGGQGEPTAFSPCPFCQHKDVGFARGTPDHFGSWDIRSDSQFVKCESCGAEGPPADWDEEARRLWNSRSSIQGAPTPPTDKELLDLAEGCNFSVWNRELYLKVVRAALGWRPKTAALSAAPPSPHPDHTASEAVAPEAKPEWPKGAFFTDGEGSFYDEQAEPLDHAFAPPAPPAPPAPLPGKESLTLSPPGNYIQTVPDHCDRIIWRGRYWALPIKSIDTPVSPTLEAAPADYPPPDAALAEFTDYFVRNYPGPDTIITDPKWHAPKLFRAAQRAISRAGLRSGVSADPLPDHDLQNVWRGIYKALDKHVPGWCINRAPGVTIAQALVRAVEKLASPQLHQVKKGELS